MLVDIAHVEGFFAVGLVDQDENEIALNHGESAVVIVAFKVGIDEVAVSHHCVRTGDAVITVDERTLTGALSLLHNTTTLLFGIYVSAAFLGVRMTAKRLAAAGFFGRRGRCGRAVLRSPRRGHRRKAGRSMPVHRAG